MSDVRHPKKIMLRVLLALGAAAAAIALNLALLGFATTRNEPVGKVSPRAAFQPLRPSTAIKLPLHPHVRGLEADD
jgi:hypothetical protein